VDLPGLDLLEKLLDLEDVLMILPGYGGQLLLDEVSLIALEKYIEIFFIGHLARHETEHEMTAIDHHRVGSLHEQEARDTFKNTCLKFMSLDLNTFGQRGSHIAIFDNSLNVRLLDLFFQDQQLLGSCLVVALFKQECN
jgi:hypothetical protein